MLQIYNSLTNRKEIFTPIEAGKIRMYVCGITVYDFCHIGHARMLIVFDTVYRYLRAQRYVVTYVRNITDIDDKIIRRAEESGEDFKAVTARYTAAMHEDLQALNVLQPEHEPQATSHISTIVKMIQRLIEKGYAYSVDNGDVYYSISAFALYGKLSGKKREDLRAGARVEIGERKKDPLDFALWKAAKPGEPAWNSPWGKGRPGWHIECSAMSTDILGPHFDIHGGGQDLQFPHHENEIAQSEACYGNDRFVNYWMHNGFVRINEEKMSKSLGNFFTIRDVLKQYRAEEVRYFILNSHYRSPLNYSDDQLDAAKASLTRLYTALRDVQLLDPGEFGQDYRNQFIKAMDDDFNTPEALATLFEIAHSINRLKTEAPLKASKAAGLLKDLGGVLGILQSEPEAYLQSGIAGDNDCLNDKDIAYLIAQRTAARASKDWAESDRIRDLLISSGVVLEDGPQGTSWRRA